MMDIDQEFLKKKIKALKEFDAGEGRLTFDEAYAASWVLLEAYEALDEKIKEQFTPRPMETAPQDGSYICLRTSNDDWVEGRWCVETDDFYKSNKRFAAAYDPENCKGTWVANYGGSDGDRRMYCGMAPNAWLPKLPSKPKQTWEERLMGADNEQ